MKKRMTVALLAMMMVVMANAQEALKKVYDDNINPMTQIDEALAKAKAEDKFVIAQVGGNWCPWCLRFADYITKDDEIMQLINDNFVYIHVNYNPRRSANPEKANPFSSCSMLTAKLFTRRIPVTWKKGRAITRKKCSASSATGHPRR